ncbi:MAG: hypothetical protein V9H25_21735 [Candidatus Competibacter sp.]
MRPSAPLRQVLSSNELASRRKARQLRNASAGSPWTCRTTAWVSQACGLAGIRRQHLPQVGQRTVEVVPVLAQHGAQQQHLGRWHGLIPPGGQRCLDIAVIARIGFGPTDFEVAAGDAERQI